MEEELRLNFPSDGQIFKLIEQIERIMLERSVNLIRVYVKDIPYVEEFVRYGFMPQVLQSRYHEDSFEIDALVQYFIEGLSEKEIQFWSEVQIEIKYVLKSLKSGHYIYGNIRGWKDFAAKTSISFPLLLYAPNQVYKSNRPKTDMLIFQTPTSLLYTRVERLDEYRFEITLNDGSSAIGIPVTRYAAGMSKGLYYNDDSKNQLQSYCGTFYYYEPESTTFLIYETSRMYFNKHEAIRNLAPILLNKKVEAVEYYHDHSKFPDDMNMTPREYGNLSGWTEDEFEQIEDLPERKHYVGENLGLYGLEDSYDQLLCEVSRNFDILILTNMIGKYQIVTEVLDNRERTISFSNLAFPL